MRATLGFKLKLDTFNGIMPLREFFSKFELIARANRWSNATKKELALASIVRGKARSILKTAENIENLDYSKLRAKLELHFGEGHLSHDSTSQIVNRRQKFGKDLTALGSERDYRETGVPRMLLSNMRQNNVRTIHLCAY